MKQRWPIIRRVLAICFLLTSIFVLGIALSLRRKVEPPAPFLAQPDVQLVYSRILPYGGTRDSIVAAYTFEGEIEAVTDQVERELSHWVAGPRGPYRADFSRGKKDDFEVITIVPGQLIQTDDGQVPPSLNGRGFVTVFYSRAKNGTESLLGSLLGGYLGGREKSEYRMLVPIDKQGPSNGGLGQGQIFWTAFEARQVDKHYVWKVQF